MENFWIVVKALGDVSIALAGIIAGSCAVSPTLLGYLRKVEDSVKASLWLRRTLGIGLIAVCSLYLIATIRMQIKSAPAPQSVSLKERTLTLANQIEDYMKHWPPTDPGKPLANIGGWQCNYRFAKREEVIRQELYDKNLHSEALDAASWNLTDTSSGEFRFSVADAKLMVIELRNLAFQLKE